MRNVLLTILMIGISLVWAEPRFVTTTSVENIQSKISQLKEMRESEELSDYEKEQLNELWEEAGRIEVMNERCGSISLTETLDTECGSFYETELPEFETSFFRITGEIRLSSTKLFNSVEKKRQAINLCYEALQIEAFYPARFYTLEGDYAAEPLPNDGIEISYDFTLQPKTSATTQLEEQMQHWYAACGSIILHSDNSGNLAPVFQDLIENSKSQAKNKKGSLYFDVEKNYGRTSLSVKTLNGINGVYFLNGRQLFDYGFSSGSTIFTISISKHGMNIHLARNGVRWHDKINLYEDEVKNGLKGRFAWSDKKPEEPAAPKAVRNSTPKSYKASYKSYGNDDEDNDYPKPTPKEDNESPKASESGFNVTFQILGGVYMAFDEASSAKGFDGYYLGENDSISQFTPYLSGLLVFEFTRSFAIGIGGGIANNRVNYEFCDSYYGEEECDEVNIYSSTVPVLTAELSLGEEINGGVRFNYVMDDDLPTYYLGGFIELANLVGIEIGWVHADDLWDNVYLGLTLRVPPRHFLERIKKNAEKNRNR